MKLLLYSHSLIQPARYLSSSSPRQLCLSYRKLNENQDDYNVLHKSVLPTMHFQKSLLRLPIPDLEKTCSRYLRAQKAILTPEEYVEAEEVIADFKSGRGNDLQDALKASDKANKHTSYISRPWFDMYLSDRSSVVLNYNPFLMFLPEERPGYAHPVIRASNILIASIRFMNTLKKGILEPEVYHLNAAKSDTDLFRKLSKLAPSSLASYVGYVMKAFPLDMSQFKNLFQSTRIPQKDKDIICDFPEAKHMMVMKNGNFYVFDLFDNDGNLHSPSHIHACMDYIYKDQSSPPAFPVSILTSENRDVWADARNELLAAGNEEALHLIDSAAFNIVFDGNKVGMEPEKCYRTFLYGDGANRWFDKSFSLIFTDDGMTALNFEHAWGDGVAVMRYFNEVVKDTQERPFVNPGSTPASIDGSKTVKKLGWLRRGGPGNILGCHRCLGYNRVVAMSWDLSVLPTSNRLLEKKKRGFIRALEVVLLCCSEFKLTPKLQDCISNALETYKRRTDSLGVNVLESNIFGKEFCKKKKVSPDAMMQLGFQLAYFLQNGEAVGSYESCSTSAFKHGRTETLRPASLETSAFCSSVVSQSNKPSDSELKEAIYKCSEMHGNLTKEAAMGQGFDRHLFGLRKLAEASGDVPQLFHSYTYAKMNHNVISTSTLPSQHISFGGFAPVVPDGYGIGYQIQDDKLGIVLSSYPPLRNGSEFIECAEKAYNIIYDVLNK